LIGAQALVVALVVIIGSQFFFITSNINRVLTGITLAMAVGFGIFLIRSVQNEIRRKEELQYLTEKLASANDELRKLDNAKSEFISIASHQLRTPLTSIKGYISLLLEGNYGKIDEVIMDPISKIYASNERLIQLVEELLNVSRIESGRMEYIFEKSSIEKITTALKDTFSVIAKGKGLYMHLNMPSEPLPEIEIDAGKTREVISNLIDNALKYTRRGGITVKSELLKDMNWSVKHAGGQDEDLSGDVVRITISDTGIGVPETELPYLFSKFSRGKDTSRLHVSGTGLGLYVGRNIIEAQHGKIWVESDGLNKGSKFIIDLPVVQPK
jgi:signal transduction histidine kinase